MNKPMSFKIFLVATTFFLSISADPSRENSSPWFLGEWHIASFSIPKMAALDSGEAESWIGNNVRISSKVFMFYTDTCSPVEYETKHLNAADFFKSHYRLSPDDMGISTPEIDVTDIHCGSRVYQSMYTTDNKSLIIDYNGVFFTLARGKGHKRNAPVELSPQERLLRAHKEAQKVFAAGARTKAAETMTEAAGGPPWSVEPATARAFEDYGFYLLEAGSFQTANDILMTVLAAFPDRMQSYLYLGDTYIGLNNEAQAKICYLHYSQMMTQAGKKKQVPARVLSAIK